MVMNERLRQVLASRQHQATWIATGIGNAHQLEITDDVLIVDDFAVELLEQAESDIRLPAVDFITDGLELVMHAERANLVASRS